LENSVIQTAGDLRSLLAGSDEILNQVKMSMKRKVDIENQVESLNQKLDEISRYLQGFDREEVVVLEKKRIEWHEQITLLAGSIGGGEERSRLGLSVGDYGYRPCRRTWRHTRPSCSYQTTGSNH